MSRFQLSSFQQRPAFRWQSFAYMPQVFSGRMPWRRARHGHGSERCGRARRHGHHHRPGHGLAHRRQDQPPGSTKPTDCKSGSYKVTIAATGFSTVEITGVTLRAGSNARADARLEVAHTGESVIVQAEAPLTEMDLPRSPARSTRKWWNCRATAAISLSFLYLNPNITPGHRRRVAQVPGRPELWREFLARRPALQRRCLRRAHVQPAVARDHRRVDGALEQFHRGVRGHRQHPRDHAPRRAQYHGSLFYDNKNSALAAWDIRDKNGQANFSPTPAQSAYPNPYFNLNEFGGQLRRSGSEGQEHIFLRRLRAAVPEQPGIYPVTPASPSDAAGGRFLADDRRAQACCAGRCHADGRRDRTEHSGRAGQAVHPDPAAPAQSDTSKLVQTYFPQTSTAAPINAANGRLVDYFTNLPGTTRRNLGTIRVDHDFREADRFYAVYNAQNTNFATPPWSARSCRWGSRRTNAATRRCPLSETHLFSPDRQRGARRLQSRALAAPQQQDPAPVSAEHRLQRRGHQGLWRRDYTFGAGHLRPSCRSISVRLRGARQRRPQHLPAAGSEPDDFRRHPHLGEGLAHHEVRRGLRPQCRDGRLHQRPRQSARPASITPAPTPIRWRASCWACRPIRSATSTSSVRRWTSTTGRQGFFVQDDFKVHAAADPEPRIALRDHHAIHREQRLAGELRSRLTWARNGKKGRYVVPSQRTLQSLDPRYIAYGVVTADQLGLPRSLVKADYNNFAPRVGVAWRVTDKTVLRGGYGLFYPDVGGAGHS